MYNNRFVPAMVAYVFEENSAREERYLQRLNINVDSIIVPRVGPYSVDHEAGKQAIEEEKEQYRPASSSEFPVQPRSCDFAVLTE